MPDKKPGGLKLKLRKADTNRLKTQTGRLKTEAAADDPAEAKTQAVPVPPKPVVTPPVQPGPAGPAAEQTSEIRDPMALRDTSQGKLRRIQSPDETASAVSPAPVGEPGVKRETVRLKVVRDTKKGGPQILPGTAAPAPAASDGDEAAPPSAQTVKISLPGLKKAASPADDAIKRATSTVRVQEPPEGAGAGGTLKVSPPGGEYRETSTSTLKVGLGKTDDTETATGETTAPEAPVAPSPSGTLKIKPGPSLALKKGQPQQSKQITATLKVVPETAPAGEEAAPPAEKPASKQVTATLKVRSRGSAPSESSDTIKITAPTGADTPQEEPAGPKPSLRLKKSHGAPETNEAERVPPPGEPGDASKTVALPPLPGLEDGDEKDSTVKLEPGSAEAEASEAVEEVEPLSEAKPALVPRQPAAGPGPISFVIRLAACGALGALVYRLVMDFLVL